MYFFFNLLYILTKFNFHNIYEIWSTYKAGC